MVLPAVLDVAPSRRIAARQRARPPGRVHHTLACGSALANTRVLRARGSTGTHDLLKIPKVPTAANFLELRKVEVRRTPLLRPWLNKDVYSLSRAMAWSTIRPKCSLERVMNLGKSRIEMRISRSAWFPR